jgi:hypothetical protein
MTYGKDLNPHITNKVLEKGEPVIGGSPGLRHFLVLSNLRNLRYFLAPLAVI